MRTKLSNILWGLFFIVVGIGFAGRAFSWWHFDIFFRGWWTLFIIIPCGISIIQNGVTTGSSIGLGIGVLLLLSQQGFLHPATIMRLIVPFIFIVIGLSIMFQSTLKRPKTIHFDNISGNNQFVATFSGQTIRFDNEVFTGANLSATFGGITADLRNAIINEDVEIICSAIFAGIDIYVPDNINVKVSSTPVFWRGR